MARRIERGFDCLCYKYKYNYCTAYCVGYRTRVIMRQGRRSERLHGSCSRSRTGTATYINQYCVPSTVPYEIRSLGFLRNVSQRTHSTENVTVSPGHQVCVTIIIESQGARIQTVEKRYRGYQLSAKVQPGPHSHRSSKIKSPSF
jgi:hypothetical protein